MPITDELYEKSQSVFVKDMTNNEKAAFMSCNDTKKAKIDRISIFAFS